MSNTVISEEPQIATSVSRASSLEWLLDPTGKQAFFAEYWEKKPLAVNRRQPDYYASLLSLDDVDRVLTTLDRRYPDVILKDASRDLSPEDYTTDGSVLDVARVCQLFAEGATITLAYLDMVLPGLTRFCRSLESEFSCPFQTNIYLTPPNAQGAKPHYDTHDVFVLQVEGSKRWTLFGTPLELPLALQDFDPDLHPLGDRTLEFELNPGDVAYVPRGVAHEARSTSARSLHITAGVLRYTWTDLLLEYVAGACLSDPAFRRSLPPGFARTGFDRSAARQTLRQLIQRTAENGDFDAALDRFVDDFLVSCPAPLQGQLAQLGLVSKLTAGSVAGARPHAVWLLETEDDSIVIHCGKRRIRIPARAADAVRYALDQPRFTIADLPSNLDHNGKVALIRRLVQEGLVVIDSL